jgi:hypothetical protein
METLYWVLLRVISLLFLGTSAFSKPWEPSWHHLHLLVTVLTAPTLQCLCQVIGRIQIRIQMQNAILRNKCQEYTEDCLISGLCPSFSILWRTQYLDNLIPFCLRVKEFGGTAAKIQRCSLYRTQLCQCAATSPENGNGSIFRNFGLFYEIRPVISCA